MKPPPTLKMPGNGLPLWLAVGHFILRAPARLARTELPVFLARIAAQPRGDADFCGSRGFIAAGSGCRGCVRATHATSGHCFSFDS